MTCIVSFIDDKNVYMGADSYGCNNSNGEIRKDTKVFLKKNMIFGCTSSFRMINILKYKFEIPKHNRNVSIDRYMNTVFVDDVIKCFEDNKFCKKINGVISGGTFLVGYKCRVFKIYDDFQVEELFDKFNACGCGQIGALTAMDALLKNNKNIEPKKLIKNVLKSVEKFDNKVCGPHKILTLKNS